MSRYMTLTRVVVWFCATSLVALSQGCRGSKPAPRTPPPPAVSVAKPVAFPVKSYFEFNGYLEAVETAQVRARVKGLLEKVHFTEGSDVIKDKTLLYTIDKREYLTVVAKAEADIEKAKAEEANADAQILLADADVVRLKRAGTGVSASELDKAVATLAASKAQLKTAKANIQSAEAALRSANINLGYTTIKAPISGRISRTLVTEGNLVGQSDATLLTNIVQMNELFVYFDVPERILIEYLKSPTATTTPSIIPVEIGVATDIGYPHVGTFDFRDNKVETGTGTVKLRGRIKNLPPEEGKQPVLYSGLFAKVRLPSGPERSLPVIPEEAVMAGQEGRFVYVIGEGNKIEKRTVILVPLPATVDKVSDWTITDTTKPGEPAKLLRSMVAVQSGLTVNDRIIVNGLLKARPGEAVNPEDCIVNPPVKK